MSAVAGLIQAALDAVTDLGAEASRERSLVRTKLQEAAMWEREHQQVARRAADEAAAVTVNGHKLLPYAPGIRLDVGARCIGTCRQVIASPGGGALDYFERHLCIKDRIEATS